MATERNAPIDTFERVRADVRVEIVLAGRGVPAHLRAWLQGAS